MERDSKLFADYTSQKTVLFFYIWDTLTISVGKAQRRKEEIIEQGTLLGIPVYLRPTGGKAVVHGGDICYTFISRTIDPRFGGTLAESFKKVNKYVGTLVSKILDLNLTSIEACCQAQKLKEQQNKINCFEHAINSEFIVLDKEGKSHKIIGAAQAMGENAFLQQGSIQINRIADDRIPQELQSQKTLSEITGEIYDLEILCQQLNTGATELIF